MVTVIKVDLRNAMNPVFKILRRIRKLPENLSKSTMRTWGPILEKDMKNSAKNAHIRSFRGILFSTGIQWRQRPNGKIGHLFMRQYGVALDSMRPHWVRIDRRRKTLLRWARQAKNSGLRKQADLVAKGKLKKTKVLVRPHPFIRQGWRKARPKLNRIIRMNLAREGKRIVAR